MGDLSSEGSNDFVRQIADLPALSVKHERRGVNRVSLMAGRARRRIRSELQVE
jgi:hypothetical protein